MLWLQISATNPTNPRFGAHRQRLILVWTSGSWQIYPWGPHIEHSEFHYSILCNPSLLENLNFSSNFGSPLLSSTVCIQFTVDWSYFQTGFCLRDSWLISEFFWLSCWRTRIASPRCFSGMSTAAKICQKRNAVWQTVNSKYIVTSNSLGFSWFGEKG